MPRGTDDVPNARTQVILVTSERAALLINYALDKLDPEEVDGDLVAAAPLRVLYAEGEGWWEVRDEIQHEVLQQLAGGAAQTVDMKRVDAARTEPDPKANAKRAGARMAKAAKEAVQDA